MIRESAISLAPGRSECNGENEAQARNLEVRNRLGPARAPGSHHERQHFYRKRDAAKATLESIAPPPWRPCL